MTIQRINEAQEVLDWLYEKIRTQKNAEILLLSALEGDASVELEGVKSTIQGSLFAHNRKIDKIKHMLEEASNDL